MTEIEELAHCGWMEDRGEGVGGCYCVMHVIMNRVRSHLFPNTIHDVIHQKNAFSWTRPTDIEHGKNPLPNDAVYDACVLAASDVIAGDSDPTKGALYYANLKTVDKDGWFEREIINKPSVHPLLLQVGHHTFYA